MLVPMIVLIVLPGEIVSIFSHILPSYSGEAGNGKKGFQVDLNPKESQDNAGKEDNIQKRRFFSPFRPFLSSSALSIISLSNLLTIAALPYFLT